MKRVMIRFGLAAALAAGSPAASLLAEGEAKNLPTLLIKGEVVSLDTTDPAASLLKVKDRYGFETPIFLTEETKISQGEAPLAAVGLTSGTAVEVEYNFDVNTAKRHAVSVKVAAAAAPSEPAPAAEAAAPEPVPVALAQPVEPVAQAAPAEPAPAPTEEPAAAQPDTAPVAQ
jgi:nucleoid-associated protein YgaU